MPAALQPPSRTATPTPIDALLAPLHLEASPQSSPSATPHRTPESAQLLLAADALPAAASSSTSLFQQDITRPSLRRANQALAAGGYSYSDSDPPTSGGWHSPRRAPPVGSGVGVDVKGKGRAVESRTATDPEREVIVHKVLKTDSFASISLKYGITPQALRASNRMWPSDPLFLRSELMIPLDQCHLPSLALSDDDVAHARYQSLTGLDHAQTYEDLMRWDVDRGPGDGAGSKTGAGPTAGEPPPPFSSSTTPRESSEFLTVWDDDDCGALGTNSGTKVLTPDLVSSLVHQQQPPSNPFAARADLAVASSQNGLPIESRTSAPGPSPEPTPTPRRPPASPPTLRIKRLPASQLAFFPAPSTSPPLPPPPPIPRSSRQDASSALGRTSSRHAENDDSSLFFRPLAKQLQQMSIPLPSFLVSPSPLSSSSSASSASLAGLGDRGRIRLPPSPGLSAGGSAAGGGGGWSLLDFGAEEDEANQQGDRDKAW
ncbi:hypothetical protein JCM3774_002003 [Rhodotorula dairenensis]